MPKYKSVYFAPDGTWFEDRKECQKYEDAQDLANWIIDTSSSDISRKDAEWVASKIIERYELHQRYNWKENVSNDFYDNEPAPKVEPESK